MKTKVTLTTSGSHGTFLEVTRLPGKRLGSATLSHKLTQADIKGLVKALSQLIK